MNYKRNNFNLIGLQNEEEARYWLRFSGKFKLVNELIIKVKYIHIYIHKFSNVYYLKFILLI